MIANSQQLQTTLQRITWLENQVKALRKTEPDRTSYLAAASGFLAELKRIRQEVREYFTAFRASRGFTLDLKDATDLIRETMPASQADVLIEHLMPSSRIVVHDDGDIGTDSIGSHFGGVPMVPRGMEWPVWDKTAFLTEEIKRFESRFQANPRATGLRDIASRMRRELSRPVVPLLFLGQLFLAEMHAAAPLPDWPTEGSLVFFYEPSAWGYDPLSRGHCQVLYFSGNEDFVPLHHPEELSSKARFPHRRLSFTREWTLPGRVGLNGTNLSVWGNEDYKELCRALISLKDEREPVHRCGGHPQEIQGDMRIECQLVSNGLYGGDSSGHQDPRRKALEKGAADWQLLVQIDSDEKRLGWMWGDVGRVYFWARQQDVKAGNFESAWAVLQCY